MALWNFRILRFVIVVVAVAAFTPVLCNVLDGQCQTGGGNTTIAYQACAPAASLLTKSAPFNLTIIPDSATCGSPPTSICLQVNILVIKQIGLVMHDAISST